MACHSLIPVNCPSVVAPLKFFFKNVKQLDYECQEDDPLILLNKTENYSKFCTQIEVDR